MALRSTRSPGRVDGYASSTKAELVGLYAAILVSPRNVPTTVYIDNMAVVVQFKDLAQKREASTERQRLRSKYAVWWAAISRALFKQGGKVTVKWVKGHAGNRGNIRADQAAKDAHFSEMWTIKVLEHNDLRCHAIFENEVVEDDLRHLLKLQSAVRTHYLWASQNRVRNYIADWREVEWKASLHILHDGNTPRGLFTSPADCHKRAHRIKKVHGMLPTLTYMRQWRPDLYETDICRMCEQEQEDIEHLWRCPMTLDEQLKGWKQAIELITKDGKRALVKEKKLWEDKQGKTQEPNLNKGGPSFTPVADNVIWGSLEAMFKGVREIRHASTLFGEEDVDMGRRNEGEDAHWTVQDLYH
ncbi:hypothetical protein BX616_005561, partial [Lobosporangium transversale]